MNTRTPEPARPPEPSRHPRDAHSRTRIVLPRPRPMGACPFPQTLLPRPQRARALPPRRAGPPSGGGSARRRTPRPCCGARGR